MAGFEAKVMKKIRHTEERLTQIERNMPILMTLFDEPMLVDYALLKMQGKDIRVQLIEGDGNVIATAATDKIAANTTEAKVKIG